VLFRSLDTSYDAVTGARVEFKPGILPGLSAGFYLPGVTTSYNAGEYFAELGFGVKYALADTVDLRLGFKSDGEDLDQSPNTAQEGSKFLWGLSPAILNTFVPGLTVWVDGEIRGIGGDPDDYYTGGYGNTDNASYTTKTDFKVAYAKDALSAYTTVAFETWTEQGTVLGIFPGISYKVTPWLTPGVDAELYIRTYEDDFKTAYKALYTEDPAGFDRLYLKFYAALALGNSFTVTPAFYLTNHSAYGTFSKVNPSIAQSNESRLDTKFELALVYGF
jgi:hypothetical protein